VAVRGRVGVSFLYPDRVSIMLSIFLNFFALGCWDLQDLCRIKEFRWLTEEG
jgi:hypothetical protein